MIPTARSICKIYGCVTQPKLTLGSLHYTLLILAAKLNFLKGLKKKKVFIHPDAVIANRRGVLAARQGAWYSREERCRQKKIDGGVPLGLIPLLRPSSSSASEKWDANWNVTPPPPPDSPVTFSRRMRAGLVIGLWDSTLLMLSFLFFFLPPPSPPPLSAVLRAVWLWLHETCSHTFHFVHQSHQPA